LLRDGRHDDARSAFQEALARVPGHPLATSVSRQGPRRTLLPVEPLLHVTAHRDERVEALAALSGRVA
jgi:hypothetical protein